MRNWIAALVCALMMVGVMACQGGSGEQSSAEGHDGATLAANQKMGKVVETMDSGGYTYVQLDTGSETIWAAAPVCQVALGDELIISTGMPMQNFRSDTLDRTFDVVYFTGGFEPAGDHSHDGDMHPSAAVQSGGGTSVKMAGGHETAKIEAADLTGISKADGGYTVAELWSNKVGLVGQSVTLRGRVVKYNSGIMGRNWLHIQDGSGVEGANDLTITTQGTAVVGEIVLVKGTVAVDKDFGMGYRYDLILEEATVNAEQ